MIEWTVESQKVGPDSHIGRGLELHWQVCRCDILPLTWLLLNWDG